MYLLITAHPDDESIFFAGLVLQKKKIPWHLVCVTNGNADGEGPRRSAQLAQACKLLGIKSHEQWNFPDVFDQRLNVAELKKRLSALPKARAIYTHCPIGEYGHPHHQDVSFAVHKTFYRKCPVWSPSINAKADFDVLISAADYKKKARILSEIYFSETKRFFNFLTMESREGFHQVGLSEATHLYEYLSGKCSLNSAKLKVYKHLAPYLKESRDLLKSRPF